MRLLLIRNDEAAFEGLALALVPAGFIVDMASCAESAALACRSVDYDALLLDVGGEAGLCEQRLRHAEIQAPVIVLAGQPAAETIARIRHEVRRARSFCHPVIFTGRLKLDLAARAAKVDGRPIVLTAREYAVLELLSLRKGRLVSTVTLFDHLNDGIESPSLRAIALHLRHLRRKLAAACGGESYIHSYGGGVALHEPVFEEAIAA